MNLRNAGYLAMLVGGLGFASGGVGCGGSKSNGTPANGGSSGNHGGAGGGHAGGAGGAHTGGAGGQVTTHMGGAGGGLPGGSGGGGVVGTGGVGVGGAGGAPLMGGMAGGDGLIGYWKFDEGSGTSVKDQTANHNDGTIRTGATTAAGVAPAPIWMAGKSGMAVGINPTTYDWVDVPSSDSINQTGFNGQVSVSAWVKLNAYNPLKEHNIVVQRAINNTRVEQFMVGLVSGTPTGSIGFMYTAGTVNVPLNAWVHFGMTYDGITQHVYMNGNEVTFQDAGQPITTDTTPITFGAGQNEADVIEQIDGLIDEVRVWDHFLSAAEIQTYANM